MNTGRVVAVCTSATSNGDDCGSDVISHAAPTFCIHVPMFETTDAIQSHRNAAKARGLQGL
jgi:hypothetical protein